MKKARWALAAALALLICPLSPAATPANERERLEALRQRLESLRHTLAETEDDRSEARSELRDSERAISDAGRELRELARQRAAADRQVRNAQAARARIESTAAERERQLGRLLAALYTSGQPGPLRVILSGRDPNQSSRDLQYLGYLFRAHAALA